MRCPYCGHDDTKVTDSRESEDGIRRRRECLNPDCNRRFTTYERVQAAPLMVVKKDGRREEFSREKVLAGIRRSCAKLEISAARIDAVVDDIEGTLQGRGLAEVPSSEVGEMVMDHLRDLDQIAYVRFASHYRSFLSVDDLQREIDRLAAPRRGQPSVDPAQPPLLPPTELSRLTGAADTRQATGNRLQKTSTEAAAPVPLDERRARRRAAR